VLVFVIKLGPPQGVVCHDPEENTESEQRQPVVEAAAVVQPGRRLLGRPHEDIEVVLEALHNQARELSFQKERL
jgi:hypothetical protein